MWRSASVCPAVLTLALLGCGGASKSSSAVGVSPAQTQTIVVRPPGNGGPVELHIEPPAAVIRAGGGQLAQFKLGRTVATQSGCLACHRIGEGGNRGPGPELTHVAERLPPQAIARSLEVPVESMPSFEHLPRAKFRALVVFLSLLR